MLDQQLKAVMQQAAEQGAPDFADLQPAECRAFFREFTGMVDAPLADVQIDDRSIPGPGGDIPIRVYTPKGSGPHPMLLYFHGGGWVIGDLDSHHGLASNLSEKAGCVVITVDYRLAPEHPFPAAVEDCYAALKWAADNAGELGADASRIAVGGDSAGGTLATVCAMLARDENGPKVAYQLLFYPVTARQDAGYESYRKYAEGHLLSVRGMQYFLRHYLGETGVSDDVRATPMNGQLSGLPPALVIVAGFDPLRDEGLDYAEKMNDAGVHVTVTEYPSLAHGFMSMSGVLDGAKQAVDQSAGALRIAFGTAA